MRVQEFSFRGSAYKLAALDRIPQDPTWFSHVDESDVRDRDWLVRPGDVALDVGSCFGSYALTALAAGASLVHCWNPRSEENEVLRQSLELNGWQDRCVIHEHGVYSRGGWLLDATGTFHEQEAEGHFRVSTLDSSLPDIPRADWLKLDVEGAEVEALIGAAALLSSLRPSVLVECHQFIDGTIQERVDAVMASHGYRLVSTNPHHSVSHSLYDPLKP